MKYIDYFKENNILLDLKNNNLFISIDTEKNNVITMFWIMIYDYKLCGFMYYNQNPTG